MDKASLRAQIKAAIAQLTPAEIQQRSAQAVARLLASREFNAAKTILAYDSGADEVGTHALLEAALQQGKTLGLPRTQPKDRAIHIYKVSDLQRDLEPSRFDFREPKLSLPEIDAPGVELIIVPGRAFDAQGNRLGRGVGYYDRFLAQPTLRATICALAFDCQLVAAVPTEAHDRRVKKIFTESRELVC